MLKLINPETPKIISFLHIGKNAGSQVNRISEQINKANLGLTIEKHKHKINLFDIPKDRDFFFTIRMPETRFKSGFYSRKRCGRPLFNGRWSPYEEQAFSDFEHANDLAEALFEEGEPGFKALSAITSISHCARKQIDWFARCGNFLVLRPPLAILRQEHFDDDLNRFIEKIEYPGEIEIVTDTTLSHRTNYDDIPALSEKAKANLYKWYREDYEFYKVCENWINQQ